MLISEAIEKFHEQSSHLSENTRRAYRYATNKLDPIRDMEINAVTQEIVDDIMRSLGEVYRQHLFVVFKGIGLDIKKGKGKSKSVHHSRWTDEQVSKFLAEAPVHVARLVAFALYTGQRKGDIIKIKWGDISDQSIRVAQEKTGRILLLPIHPMLRAWIQDIPRREERDHVLCNHLGAPWTAEAARRAVARSSDAILQTRLCIHGLRHTAASKMAERGASAPLIAAVTGHSSLSQVARYIEQANQYKMAQDALSKL